MTPEVHRRLRQEVSKFKGILVYIAIQEKKITPLDIFIACVTDPLSLVGCNVSIT